MSFWAPLALTAATTTMLVLPLTPALLELHQRRDAAPLPTRSDDGDIRSFGHSFRRYLEPALPVLAEARERQSVNCISMADGQKAIVIGKSGLFEFAEPTVNTLVLCAGDIALPPQVTFTADFFCGGDLYGNDGDIFRAILTEGSAILGDKTVVLRWFHAGGAIQAGLASSFFGRLSSETQITLADGCKFERMKAPVITTGIETVPAHLARSSAHAGRSTMDLRIGRLRASGDFHMAAGDMLQGHVVAAGAVRIDEGTKVVGSVKGQSNTVIDDRAEVSGTVVSASDVEIKAHCYVGGPVLAEGEIVIGRDTQVGSPDAPTTVSAPRIRIAPGAVIYGTVWARTSGEVEG